MIMQATDQILFRPLCLMITNTHVEFQSNRLSSLREKVEETNIAYYDIDVLGLKK